MTYLISKNKSEKFLRNHWHWNSRDHTNVKTIHLGQLKFSCQCSGLVCRGEGVIYSTVPSAALSLPRHNIHDCNCRRSEINWVEGAQDFNRHPVYFAYLLILIFKLSWYFREKKNKFKKYIKCSLFFCLRLSLYFYRHITTPLTFTFVFIFW